MDKLRAIETFVTAVDLGSFSAAARRLDLTAVMVGKHVRQLETHLGARLLERTTRNQSLTDAGRRFYEEGKKVLEQMAWAEGSVERLRSRPAGTLRITAATTLGQYIVAPLAADYQLAYPEVQIELSLSNSVVDLIDEGVDLAIRVGNPDPQLDLVARPLGTYAMVICAAPGYLDRYGTPASPADLARHRCLGQLMGTSGPAWVLPVGETSTPWPPDAPFRCNDGRALRQAALRGAGLLLQPYILVADDLAAGRLVRVLSDHLPEGWPVHALYRRDRHPLPKTATFVDFLLEHVPPMLAVPAPSPGPAHRTRAARQRGTGR